VTDHDTGERRVTDILLVLSGPNAGECFVQLAKGCRHHERFTKAVPWRKFQ
jgi:hypothetical protein